MSSTALKTRMAVGLAKWEPLIATKFFIPRARPDLVQRLRLIEHLNEGLKRKLTIVAATAGSGKTTLLSAWCDSALGARIPAAWLSLDEDDNDPTRFWAYLIRSLGTIKEGVDEHPLSLLVSPNPPPIESVVTALINELAGIALDFILILDDYHVIKAQPIHEAITFMIDHQPPRMHLIISGRSKPPLPFTRLRGSAQLSELGRLICGSPGMKLPPSLNRSWASIFHQARWPPWKTEPKAGLPGFRWPRFPCRDSKMSQATSGLLPAMTAV